MYEKIEVKDYVILKIKIEKGSTHGWDKENEIPHPYKFPWILIFLTILKGKQNTHLKIYIRHHIFPLFPIILSYLKCVKC